MAFQCGFRATSVRPDSLSLGTRMGTQAVTPVGRGMHRPRRPNRLYGDGRMSAERTAEESLAERVAALETEVTELRATLTEALAEVRDREVAQVAAARRAEGDAKIISGDELIDELGVERSKI